jgi:hypothetical protein
MADETERYKPVEKKEGLVILPSDREITHEDAEAIVAHFKALHKAHQEAKAAKAGEAQKAAAQDVSANTSSSESAAKEQG